MQQQGWLSHTFKLMHMNIHNEYVPSCTLASLSKMISKCPVLLILSLRSASRRRRSHRLPLFLPLEGVPAAGAVQRCRTLQSESSSSSSASSSSSSSLGSSSSFCLLSYASIALAYLTCSQARQGSHKLFFWKTGESLLHRRLRAAAPEPVSIVPLKFLLPTLLCQLAR